MTEAEQALENARRYTGREWEWVQSTIESADAWLGPNGELGDYCSPNGFSPYAMREVQR